LQGGGSRLNSSDDSKQGPQIGDDYQAQIPILNRHRGTVSSSSLTLDKEGLVWCPDRLSDSSVGDYLDHVHEVRSKLVLPPAIGTVAVVRVSDAVHWSRRGAANSSTNNDISNGGGSGGAKIASPSVSANGRSATGARIASSPGQKASTASSSSASASATTTTALLEATSGDKGGEGSAPLPYGLCCVLDIVNDGERVMVKVFDGRRVSLHACLINKYKYLHIRHALI
jgi:ELM2 domain